MTLIYNSVNIDMRGGDNISRRAYVILGHTIPEWSTIIDISYMSAYLKFRGLRDFKEWELRRIMQEAGFKTLNDLVNQLEEEKKQWKTQ